MQQDIALPQDFAMVSTDASMLLRILETSSPGYNCIIAERSTANTSAGSMPANRPCAGAGFE